MTTSRRGFFATLAALPAVLMGRRALAAPEILSVVGNQATLSMPVWQRDAKAGEEVTLVFKGLTVADPEQVRRDLQRIAADWEQHTGRRLGS